MRSLFSSFRLELCSFSGFKINPGHGTKYVRTDGKVFTLANGKCEAAFMAKRNPREAPWTVLYRRKHKKGQSEEVSKKHKRGAVKPATRPIRGTTLAEIMAKRKENPEVRAAQREQAAAAKGAKKAKEANKTQAKTEQPKFAKPVMKNAPRVRGKR